MPVDFSGYQPNSPLVPRGTIVLTFRRTSCSATRPTGLTLLTKDRSAEMLKTEFTFLEGLDARRKVFGNFPIVIGTTEGQKSWSARNKWGCSRASLQKRSIRRPERPVAEARAKLTAEPWRDFDGLRFLAQIGIEKGKDGFEDKNIIARAITRDMPQWGNRSADRTDPADRQRRPQEGGGTPSSGSPTPPIVKPPWAS